MYLVLSNMPAHSPAARAVRRSSRRASCDSSRKKPVKQATWTISVKGERAELLVEDPALDSLDALAAREQATLQIETPTLEDLFVELA